jgi:hypothetical protein
MTLEKFISLSFVSFMGCMLAAIASLGVAAATHANIPSGPMVFFGTLGVLIGAGMLVAIFIDVWKS